MRPARLGSALVVAVILAVAACSSEQPGWTYAPPPSETPIPSGPAGSEAPEASMPASPGTSAGAESPAASAPAASGGAAVVKVSALNIQFEQSTLDVPADTAFTLEFANNDPAVPHDVDIRDSAGTSVFKTEIFPGPETRTFDAPALAAGAYQFVCTVHPTMIIDVTAG